MGLLRADTGKQLQQVQSFTLGTNNVAPLNMAAAYATFAARGKRPDTLVVTKIVASNGQTIAERRPRTEQVISQNVADTVSWILKQNVTGGTGTAAKIQWPAMGKTGTAQDHQDASFVGSTPELTTAVWMGYPPNPATGEIPLMSNVRGRKVTGGSFPATIWKKFMAEALKLYEKHGDFPSPKISGEVLSPPPLPCPEQPSSGTDGSPGADAGASPRADGQGDPCAAPQASPSPTPTEICGEFPFQPCGQPEDDDNNPDTPPSNRRNESPRPCPFLRCETPTPTQSAGPQPPPAPPPPPPTGGGGLFPPCFPNCPDASAAERRVAEEDDSD
jgi:membrane peptidoglycan carboxypeptidase